jgi:hypothetical protein
MIAIETWLPLFSWFAEWRRLAKRVLNWWRGRMIPATPQPRHLSTVRDLSVHVLRDIGYIDARLPPETTRRDDFY